MYLLTMEGSYKDKVTLEHVKRASGRIKDLLKKTPVFEHEEFNSEYGRKFYFKAESMQKTGAFKVRGALNAVLCKKERGEKILGLVTHSSGNHGYAVAWIARMLEVPCIIMCPTTVPEFKLESIRSMGAEIVICDPSPTTRLNLSLEIEREKGYIYIPTSQSYDVIAGQGTIVYEFLDQVPDLDAILVPVSAGGMISGICLAAKALKPNIKVFAIQPVGKDLEKCLEKGERLWPEPPQCVETIADGMRMQQIGHVTWPIILDHVEKHVFSITDEDIVRGMKYAFKEMKLVIEPSAGAAVAAAMSRDLQEMDPSIKNVGVVLCGGNADLEHFPWQ